MLFRYICIGSLIMSGDGSVFIHGDLGELSDTSLEIKTRCLKNANALQPATRQTHRPVLTQLIISIINNTYISLPHPRLPRAFIFP